MSSFNLLLSTNRNYEKKAELEVWFYLFILGDEDPLIIRSPIDGLLLINTSLDPYNVINSLRKIIRKNSEFPKFIIKLIPIDFVIETDLNFIHSAVKSLLENNKAKTQKGSYCIQIKKRATNLSGSEIIDKIARIVENPVSLKNPNWIVRIEIIGNIEEYKGNLEVIAQRIRIIS